MSYATQYSLSQDQAFRSRVRVAMLTAAVAVQAEDPETPNHANRANFAKLVLSSPDSYMPPFSEAVCTNAVITAESLDSDILFTVNSMFNALAGVI